MERSGNSTECDRTTDSKSYWFVISSVLTFLCGLIIILLCRFIYFLVLYYKQHEKHVVIDPDNKNLCVKRDKINASNLKNFRIENHGFTHLTAARYWATNLISGKTLFGRILLILQFTLSFISMCIYFYDTTKHVSHMERCIKWKKDFLAKVDLACHVFFFVHFWILFVAASDKLSFWLKLYSFVEYATVPPNFMILYLNRSWVGLRFMRTLKVMTLPDILQHCGIVRSSTNIRLLQLSTIFLTIWTCGAGVYHLLENTGDPWLHTFNGERNSYGVALYYTVVTMSTVGYGDIYPKTTLGKVFISIYILGALAIFASYVPEIASILFSKSKYAGSFRKEDDRKHIIVCGNINSESVDNFLADFLHKDRELTDVTIVFINRRKPDLEMEALLKRNFTQVEYFEGTVLNVADCERVCLDCADAVIVIADKHCKDAEAEDSANIMRVISIKNFAPKSRVIVQLLQYSSKALLLNIPFWDGKNSDEVICLDELKLGFMAQNCIAPGFSTFMANLFTVRSFKMDSKSKKCNEWMLQYQRGSAMEIYEEHFSEYFHGMNFNEAAKVCFEKLNIILLAVEARCKMSNELYVVLNAGKKVIINQSSQGYFVGDSHREVSRVCYYCAKCHATSAAKDITKCACFDNVHDALSSRRLKVDLEIKSTSNNDDETIPMIAHTTEIISSMDKQESCEHAKLKLNLHQSRMSHQTENDPQLDSTGMFHWCPERLVEDVTLTIEEAAERQFKNHIVVCIFSGKKSPLIGLRNFVMPLRASSFHAHQLKEIVFIGDGDFLRREWSTIQNFPYISIVAGSAMNRAVLRSVCVNTCDMCVILSAKVSSKDVDPYLADKEVILCSLNIKSMQFDDSSLQRDINQDSATFKTSSTELTVDPTSMKTEDNNPIGVPQIPMITELVVDSNIQFLDQDDKKDNNEDLFMTQPFVTGSVFTVSVLDSLISTAYFNHNAMTLIRNLLTGGVTPKFERIIAEGLKIQGAKITADKAALRRRSRVQQISFQKGKFLDYANATFGQLFIHALDHHGILCLGVYRIQNNVENSKRYVITNPAIDFQLNITDLVYGLHPYDENCSLENKDSQIR